MEAFSLDSIIEKSVTEYRRQQFKQENKMTWMKGLVAALIGGAVVGATQAMGAGRISGSATGTSAAVGAAIALGGYLTQSPVVAPAKVEKKGA